MVAAEDNERSTQRSGANEMKRGVHTIRSGIANDWDFSKPRRYTLDNGDFELNMMLTDLEIIPIGNDETGGNQNDLDTDTIFFVISNTELGAIPTSTTVSEYEYGAAGNLRLSDSAQFAWGVAAPGLGYVRTLVDPDHIIPGDVYVNAWSLTSAGTLTHPAWNIGFLLRFEQKKSSGSEALLYQSKEAAADN